jgi:hypothetical protein
MIVAGTQLSLGMSHQYAEAYERSESLRAWVGTRPPDPIVITPVDGTETAAAQADDYVTGRLAAQSRHLQARMEFAAVPAPQAAFYSDVKTTKQQTMEILLEKMFGMTGIRSFSFEIDYSQIERVQYAAQTAQAARQQAASGQPLLGWGVEYDFHESYEEREQTTFALSGTMTTDDGSTLAVSFTYQMRRDYVRTTDVRLRLGDAKPVDPLVLDFGGGGGLDAQTTAIDLDGDGKAENVARLQSGQYFLARDVDGDGRISGGSELFGPRTGSGFTELGALDEDRNGFIDSGDSSFQDLRLWNGVDAEPVLLFEFHVAAISVFGLEAKFSYKDADNRLLGENRKIGMYLTDDGTTGAVKQIDLVV